MTQTISASLVGTLIVLYYNNHGGSVRVRARRWQSRAVQAHRISVILSVPVITDIVWTYPKGDKNNILHRLT